MQLDRGTTLVSHNILYNTGVFIWIFGQNTIWLQVPDTRVPEGVGQAGSVGLSDFGAPTTTTILSNGWGVTHNYFNFTTPDRRARRVTSNESFKARKLWPAATAVTADVRFTIFMLGILYAQL